MKIIIWDSTRERCTANQTAIESAAQALSIVVQVQVWTEPLAPSDGSLTPQCDLLLLHAPTDENVAMSWFRSKAVTVPRILKYSGGGIRGGVPRAVSDRDPLNQIEAKGILEAARDTSTQRVFLDRVLTIWSAFPVNLLAFRLLCEAKQACGIESKAEINGITVHAPENIGHWLAPFGKSKVEHIGEVAVMIGNGELKTKAKAVLDAVLEAVSSEEKLNLAIGEFLKTTASDSVKY